ncbi:hypothetical protein RFI_30587, partial [Reticulomyxa filosa]
MYMYKYVLFATCVCKIFQKTETIRTIQFAETTKKAKNKHKYEEKADRNEKVHDMTTAIEQKVNEPVKSILANDDNKNKEENTNANANDNGMTTNNKSSCTVRQIYIYFNKLIK